MTVFGIFMLLITIVIGGLALDVANAMRMRTHLQVAADSAAYAALMVAIETQSPTIAKQAAVEIARGSMPQSAFGDVIRQDDIVFGHWDETTRQFTASPGATGAVLVDASQIEERQNSVGTYFLKFANFDQWNIRRQSIYQAYLPCDGVGFMAEDVVTVTSGNSYVEGFCIHSNTTVELSNGNTFEPGVVVSMPDKRDLVMPSDGFTSNVGLREALRDGSIALRVTSRIDSIEAGLRDPSSSHYRSYITSSTVVNIPRSTLFDIDKWESGRIHRINCTGAGQKVQIPAGTVVQSGVLMTNCVIQFGQGVRLEDVTIFNSNTGAASFNSPSSFVLGRDDSCVDGGGAQLITRGGVNFAQGFQMFGGQIIAAGDVSFTSAAFGGEGASIISGGFIQGSTNSLFGVCHGAGGNDGFATWYARMVM